MIQIDIPAFKKTPIPAFAPLNAKKSGYRDSVPIDGADRLHAERCVDVRELGVAGVNYYHTPFNPPYYERVPGAIPELYLRRSVAERLVMVNEALAPAGLELFLFDGWRPQSIQRHFHGVWFPAWLRQHRPEIAEEDLMDEVERYWAAPSDGEASPSPHSTGGATDLTLRFTETGQPLFMGGLFDDLTENAHSDWFERQTPQSMSDQEAQANRRLLYWIMAQAGFANNPTEWWHYSHGDQMWAKLGDFQAAVYGACDPVSADGGL